MAAGKRSGNSVYLESLEYSISLLSTISDLLLGDSDVPDRQDLHVHSRLSDGVLSPHQLFEAARRDGIKAMSITDHNSLGSLDVLRNHIGDCQCVMLVPGVELSTGWASQRVHIIGYFPTTYLPRTMDIVSRIRSGHWQRERLRLRLLQAKCGVRLTESRLRSVVGERTPNWRLIAEALVQSGDAVSIEDASQRLLKPGCPGHISYADDWSKVSPQEAVHAITEDFGVPVIAHLGDIESALGPAMAKSLIEKLCRCGLEGFDTSCADGHHAMSSEMHQYAEQRSLYPVGGTDNHSGMWNEAAPAFSRRLFVSILRNAFRQYTPALRTMSFAQSIQPIQLPKWNFFQFPPGVAQSTSHDDQVTPAEIAASMVEMSNSHIPPTQELRMGVMALLSAIRNTQCEATLRDWLLGKEHVTASTAQEQVRSRLAARQALIEEMQQRGTRDEEVLTETASIYYPIAYRTCFYDVGAQLRDASLLGIGSAPFRSFAAFYAHILEACAPEHRWRQAQENVVSGVLSALDSTARVTPTQIIVRARKSVGSAYAKFVRCWLHGSDPKNPRRADEAAILLQMFQSWCEGDRELTRHCNHDLPFLVQSVFEDALAITILIPQEAKEVISRVEVARAIGECVSHLECWSTTRRRWYHDRLLIWGIEDRVPVEVLIKTEPQYWLGALYYWMTKDINVFADAAHPTEDHIGPCQVSVRSQGGLQHAACCGLVNVCSRVEAANGE